jgi:hypothetical protein
MLAKADGCGGVSSSRPHGKHAIRSGCVGIRRCGRWRSGLGARRRGFLQVTESDLQRSPADPLKPFVWSQRRDMNPKNAVRSAPCEVRGATTSTGTDWVAHPLGENGRCRNWLPSNFALRTPHFALRTAFSRMNGPASVPHGRLDRSIVAYRCFANRLSLADRRHPPPQRQKSRSDRHRTGFNWPAESVTEGSSAGCAGCRGVQGCHFPRYSSPRVGT